MHSKKVLVVGDNDDVTSPSVSYSKKLDKVNEISSKKKYDSSGPKTQDKTHVARTWGSGKALN